VRDNGKPGQEKGNSQGGSNAERYGAERVCVQRNPQKKGKPKKAAFARKKKRPSFKTMKWGAGKLALEEQKNKRTRGSPV